MGTVASRPMGFRDAHHFLSAKSASLNLNRSKSAVYSEYDPQEDEDAGDDRKELTIPSRGEKGRTGRRKSTSSLLASSKSCSNLYAKQQYSGHNLFFENTTRPLTQLRKSKNHRQGENYATLSNQGAGPENSSPGPERAESCSSRGDSSGCYCDDSDCSSASLASGGSCSVCLEEFDPKHAEATSEQTNETIYCTLGSLCSRRSKATVRSRKVKGKGWKSRPKLRHKLDSGSGISDVEAQSSQSQAEDLSAHVAAFDEIVAGPLKSFLTLSAKIGGDVATQGGMVSDAFTAQRHFLVIASKSKLPTQAALQELLKATSDKINEIQAFRESNRRSPFFNHLSALSESIAALGWVAVSPAPAPFVKEMNDAGQFYTNRVLKDWKEKDKAHVEWTKAWAQALSQLQAYVKQYHTTGLVWNAKGGDAMGAARNSAPSAAPLPPPPPPPGLFDDIKVSENPEKTARNALFDELNKGENVTQGLKKVTADMQTHKNPTLRATGEKPIPGQKPTLGGAAKAAAKPIDKPSKFELDGKKWIVEYFKNNPNIVIDNTETNQSVYVFRCEGSTIKVGGKCNNIILDGCKKTAVVFDNVVSSCEFINCQSVQMQVLGKVPTISVDKTDGCQMYLSKDSIHTEIITAKSTEMNVMIPSGEDFVEQPVPEQFKTTIKGTKLTTTISEGV